MEVWGEGMGERERGGGVMRGRMFSMYGCVRRNDGVAGVGGWRHIIKWSIVPPWKPIIKLSIVGLWRDVMKWLIVWLWRHVIKMVVCLALEIYD